MVMLKDLQVKQQWGTANWTSFEFAFQFCYNLDVTATDKPNLSKNNIRLTSMFSNCSSLIGNSSFGSWITSNVASMSSMFESNYNFNQDIGNWNTENVVYMYNIFRMLLLSTRTLVIGILRRLKICLICFGMQKPLIMQARQLDTK